MGYWEPGKKLDKGKYIVEEILGSGGFGVTYKVKETRTNKFLAVKTLKPQLQEEQNFQQLQVQFINEVITLASCRHPHIVRVHRQVFQEEKLMCMVMEYIAGQNLAKYIGKQGKFSEPDAINIITKIGSALSSVHQEGILHRDIKPDNILLRQEDKSPVLIDFGLAREVIQELTLQSMSYNGTLFYAPVEEYEKKGNFGTWTDVYELAATLYVLVTGIAPGLMSSIRKYEYVINKNDPLKAPKQHNPNLSDRINEAVLKGMEIEPENRPQSVEEWLELLKPTSDNIVYFGNSPVTLQVFEFDTVTVNDRGKVIKQEHHSAKYFTENLGQGITMDMVAIPGGTFMMGTEEQEIERLVKKYNWDWFRKEKPQHKVKVPAFYMGKFQVTQEQWQAVAKLPKIERQLPQKPSFFKGDKLSVDSISWYDAVEFCARVSRATGKEYRLPSEAEWEYACRAGTTTPFYFGTTITSKLANYRGNSTYAKEAQGEYRGKTTFVGTFPPQWIWTIRYAWKFLGMVWR